MRPDEVLDVLSGVRLCWPSSDIDGGDPAGAARVWAALLAPFDRVEVDAVLERELISGRKFAPGISELVHGCLVRRQGEPPSIDDAQRTLARLMASCAPHDARGAEDTAVTVERLAARGVHEAVLRFVQEQGVYAVRTMPDPDGHGLDVGQAADRRDKARHYRDVTVRGWRDDPRPGLALERARVAAGELGRGGQLRRLGAGE